MASPFSARQHETTVLDVNSEETETAGKLRTETKSSSTPYQVKEHQSAFKASITNPTMFFRRRTVILSLSLILAILIITFTIIGVFLSSSESINQEEAEARKAKNNNTENENELDISKAISIIEENFNDILDNTETIDVKDTSSFIFPPAPTTSDAGGSGSDYLSTEATQTDETTTDRNNFSLSEVSSASDHFEKLERPSFTSPILDTSGSGSDYLSTELTPTDETITDRNSFSLSEVSSASDHFEKLERPSFTSPMLDTSGSGSGHSVTPFYIFLDQHKHLESFEKIVELWTAKKLPEFGSGDHSGEYGSGMI